MAVLVTGAAGFIGFNTASRLMARGEEVVGLDNLNDYYSVELKRARLAELARRHGKAFHFEQADFAVQVALQAALKPYRIDGIIHLGAQAGVRYSLSHPHAYIQSNIVGHLNLLEFARHQVPAGHMVYASSSSVYGKNEMPPTGLAVENRVDQPISLYAATKKADELMSECYSHLHRLKLTGLRFFTVYGPWGRPDMAMWLFTKAMLSDEPIQVFNNGQMRRDFTFIDDIVSGVVACYDNPPPDDGKVKAGGSVNPHRLYNIGNHRSEDLIHMIGILEEALGRKARKELLPMQAGDVKETFADITAIQNDLNYTPTTGIEAGIPRFVDWYRDYHGL
jgi:UDP-glucuronate 4-epimerase